MPDWVVMTVGLNPLPCLIEAFRICEAVYEEKREWPRFLVFTGDRSHEADEVQNQLLRKLRAERNERVSLEWKRVNLNDPYDPVKIIEAAAEHIRKLPPSATVHLPYTGGTKAMSIHVFEALRQSIVIPSYLSPHDHKLRSSTGQDESKGDERENWALRIEDLAALHFFRTGDASVPAEGLAALSARMLGALMGSGRSGGEHGGYSKWLGSEWKHAFGGGNDRDVRIEDFRDWRDRSIVFYRGTTEEWTAFAGELATVPVFGGRSVFNRSPDGGLIVKVGASTREFIVPLFKFLHNQALEIYAHSALHRLIPESYDLKHSVHCYERSSGQECELDVVAVLGYQLFAVSCTLSKNYANCKRKGFEIIHRARQVGGAGARAVLLCLLDRAGSEKLERELLDDLQYEDGIEKPLRIFGRDTLGDAGSRQAKLETAFRRYLTEGLGWTKLR